MNSTSHTFRLGAWPKSTPWFLGGYAVLGLATVLLPPLARGLGLNLLNTAVFTHAGILSVDRSRRESSDTCG